MNEDISYSRPSLFHPVAVKKWNAWHQLLGMSKEEAMLRYIRTLTSIDPDWEQHPALDNYSMDYPMTWPCYDFIHNTILFQLKIIENKWVENFRDAGGVCFPWTSLSPSFAPVFFSLHISSSFFAAAMIFTVDDVSPSSDLDTSTPPNGTKKSKPKSSSGKSSAIGSGKNSSLTCQWLLDNFDEAENSHIAREIIFNQYCLFCKDMGHLPMNAASFGKIIRTVFPTISTRRLGTRGNSKCVHTFIIMISYWFMIDITTMASALKVTWSPMFRHQSRQRPEHRNQRPLIHQLHWPWLLLLLLKLHCHPCCPLVTHRVPWNKLPCFGHHRLMNCFRNSYDFLCQTIPSSKSVSTWITSMNSCDCIASTVRIWLVKACKAILNMYDILLWFNPWFWTPYVAWSNDGRFLDGSSTDFQWYRRSSWNVQIGGGLGYRGVPSHVDCFPARHSRPGR